MRNAHRCRFAVEGIGRGCIGYAASRFRLSEGDSNIGTHFFADLLHQCHRHWRARAEDYLECRGSIFLEFRMLEHGNQHSWHAKYLLAAFLLDNLQRFERVEGYQRMQRHLRNYCRSGETYPRDMEKWYREAIATARIIQRV